VVYIGYARMVNTLGTVGVAAQYIAVQAENLSWMLASGFAMATAAMVGQRLGAGRPEAAEEVSNPHNIPPVLISTGVDSIFLDQPWCLLFTFLRKVQRLVSSAGGYESLCI